MSSENMATERVVCHFPCIYVVNKASEHSRKTVLMGIKNMATTVGTVIF
jgi:hypothetical protein